MKDFFLNSGTVFKVFVFCCFIFGLTLQDLNSLGCNPGARSKNTKSQPLDHQGKFLCLLFNINTFLKNLFLFFAFFLFSNPCVQDWLSVDHSKGAALLPMKPQPRSRSSSNGLAPGSPQTCGGDRREGSCLSDCGPCLRMKGFLHQTRS